MVYSFRQDNDRCSTVFKAGNMGLSIHTSGISRDGHDSLLGRQFTAYGSRA
jgi:hypothetical protein